MWVSSTEVVGMIHCSWSWDVIDDVLVLIPLCFESLI